MNLEQITFLKQFLETTKTISVWELKNKKDRTLIYGYTCERHTFHLYLKNEKFYCVVYDHDKNFLYSKLVTETIGVDDCFPNKRVYPESCDFEFAILLASKNSRPTYLAFNPEREEKVKHLQFHGEIVDDVIENAIPETTL